MDLSLPPSGPKRLALFIGMFALLILSTGLIGYLLGMDNICEANGAVLAKDAAGFTCLLPEQIGKVCFDQFDPALDNYRQSFPSYDINYSIGGE